MEFNFTDIFDKKNTIKIKDDVYNINDSHEAYLTYIDKMKNETKDSLNVALELGIKEYDLFNSKKYCSTILTESMYAIMSIWTGRKVEDLKVAVEDGLKK